jgi:hypothetical protein
MQDYYISDYQELEFSSEFQTGGRPKEAVDGYGADRNLPISNNRGEPSLLNYLSS